jgi:hypothetical protein
MELVYKKAGRIELIRTRMASVLKKRRGAVFSAADHQQQRHLSRWQQRNGHGFLFGQSGAGDS